MLLFLKQQTIQTDLIKVCDVDCQTDITTQNDLIKGCDVDCQTEDMEVGMPVQPASSDECLESINSLFQQIPESEELVCSYAFFKDLQFYSLCQFFGALGSIFNKQLYEQLYARMKHSLAIVLILHLDIKYEQSI